MRAEFLKLSCKNEELSSRNEELISKNEELSSKMFHSVQAVEIVEDGEEKNRLP